MKYGLLMLALLLAGCVAPAHQAINEKFPDYCDIKQPDKEGTGYTVGQFPCKLTHKAGTEKP